MTTCIHDDERICMSSHEHDCQHCSIAGRRQIKQNPVSGFRHVHGRAFIEAFDKAYKLKEIISKSRMQSYEITYKKSRQN